MGNPDAPRVDPIKSFEKKELSSEEAADILFWSFHYSQGRTDLQSELITALAALNPGLTVAKDDTLVQKNLPRFVSFLRGKLHKPISYTEVWGHGDEEKLIRQNVEEIAARLGMTLEDAYIYYNAENQWTVMQKAFSSTGLRPGRIMPVQYAAIIDKMIERDFEKTHEQVETNGPKRKWMPSERPNPGGRPDTGPHARRKSHFLSYVVNERQIPGPAIFPSLMHHLHELSDKDNFVTHLDLDSFKRLYWLRQYTGLDLEKCPELSYKYSAISSQWESPELE